MKIFEIGTGYTPIPAQMGAATEIVVEELTKSFLKNNIDVTILDIKAENRIETKLPIVEVPVPRQFIGTDVQLGIMHKLKRVIYSISLASTLKKLLRKSDEKVILHFHNQYNMYFFLKLVPKKLRNNCVLAYTNHSYIWHDDWTSIKETVQKRYFQEIYAMKHADYIYVLNTTTYRTLVEKLHIPENKIKMIDNGVNTDVYSPLTKEENIKVKDKLGLSGKRVLIQIGSVCDRKNQLGAIELLQPILKENLDVVYVYAGGIIDKEYQEKINSFTEEYKLNNQVKYLGELKPGKGLNECYSMAAAMIFPSKSEGFSLVIIESMSAGTPVLIHENLQFKLAGKCCRFSDKKDFIKVFEEKILDDEQLIEESRKTREVVLERYSWDKIANDYYQSWVNE